MLNVTIRDRNVWGDTCVRLPDIRMVHLRLPLRSSDFSSGMGSTHCEVTRKKKQMRKIAITFMSPIWAITPQRLAIREVTSTGPCRLKPSSSFRYTLRSGTSRRVVKPRAGLNIKFAKAFMRRQRILLPWPPALASSQGRKRGNAASSWRNAGTFSREGVVFAVTREYLSLFLSLPPFLSLYVSRSYSRILITISYDRLRATAVI